MDRNEAAAELRHAEVLATVLDAMEITRIRARLEAEREPKLQHPA